MSGGRVVELTGGPPWGFRVTGGRGSQHPLKISRVNPGSQAESLVREGEAISSINGEETANLTREEANACLRAASDQLLLVLNRRRGGKEGGERLQLEEDDRMVSKPIQLVNVRLGRKECVRLPGIPPSPEYIWLSKESQRKRSGSCSSLPEWAECRETSQDDTGRTSAEPVESSELSSSLTSSLTLDSEEEERSEGNQQQQGRQQAWLRTIRATRSTKAKMRLVKGLIEQGYASDPECGRAVGRKLEEGRRRRRTQTKKRGEGRRVGRIENWQPLAEKEHKKKKKEKKEEGERETKKSRKYVHEILAGESDELRSVRVEKESGDESSEEGELGGREVYRAVQGGGEIPLTGLGRRKVEKVEGRAGEYVQERINIHYPTPVVAEVKEEVSEDILDEIMEERMVQVYTEMAEKKIRQMQEELEQRRHHDNLLPAEKKKIGKVHYNSEVNGNGQNKMYRALFSFSPDSPKELRLQAGQLVRVTGRVDNNWSRGEVNGRKGIFPSSYIALMPECEGGKVLVRHSFRSSRLAELSVVKGEVVELVRSVDSNWVEVKLGERRGLVPVSYLQQQEEGGEEGGNSIASSPLSPRSPSPGVVIERVTRPTDIIKSRLRGQFTRRERSMEVVERFLTEELGGDTSSGSSSPVTPVTANHAFEVRVISTHLPEDQAELFLRVGETIVVLEDFSDGWMAGMEKGTNRMGLFPTRCVLKL